MGSADVLLSRRLDASPPTAVARLAARVLSGLDHDLDDLLEDATLTVCRVLRIECCAVVQLDAHGDGVRVRVGHTAPARPGIERVEIPLPALPRGLLVASKPATGAWQPDELAFLAAVGELLDSALERRVLEDELRGRALHDILTGLPNRLLLMDHLAHLLARRDRHEREVAVLFIDLDGFKLVNDRLGHLAGDQLLRQFASRLQGLLRSSDVLARLGGDEFVVLAGGLPAGGSAAVARRILAAAAEPFSLDPGPAAVTASIGIATARPSDTADRLLAAADDALYLAKRAGRATARPAPP